MPAQSTALNTDTNSRLTSSYYEDSGDAVSKWLQYHKTADGGNIGLGSTTQSEATGNGSVIQILKRIRTLLGPGIPAVFSTGGGMRVGLVDPIPAGTANIGDVDVLTLPALASGTNVIGSVTRHSELVCAASASRNASGQGSDVDFSPYKRGIFFVDVTVASSLSLNLFLQAKSTTLGKYARIKQLTNPTPAAPTVSPSQDLYINGDGSTNITTVLTYAYAWDAPLPATGRLDWVITGSGTFSVYFIGES